MSDHRETGEGDLSDQEPTEPMDGLGGGPDRSEAPTEAIGPGVEPQAAAAGQTEPLPAGTDEPPTRWSPPTGTGLLMLSIWAAVALTVAYIFAGGTDYRPTPVADPCDPREWSQTETVDEIAQQFALSALDGAACDLGVTREELTRALASSESLDRFSRDNDLSPAEVESAIRSGADRAIDDAERAGAISPLVGFGLKAAVRTLPLQDLIALIQDASALVEGEGGLEAILPEALGGLEQGLDGEGGFDLDKALEGITGQDGLDLQGGLEGLLGPDGPDLRKGLEGLFGGGEDQDGGGGGALDLIFPPDPSTR